MSRGKGRSGNLINFSFQFIEQQSSSHRKAKVQIPFENPWREDEDNRVVDRRGLFGGRETGDGEFLLGRRNTSLRYLILIICLSLMLSQILLLIYSICRFELLSIASTLLHERDLYFSEFSDSFILHVWCLKTSWGWGSSADQDTLNGKSFLILTKNSWHGLVL